ncbi:MAG: flagellar hook-length control protein FliK [Candidatus Abyssobacteria bacterium SURF_17]|uniref:Flagellar hook-length control protein FliK n=1 Tax=Candidatus Abyssobacteria bacterium SURF_17 TaxID=2093361 RepID=A0A419EY89_9BACT|nr:MAG: flagellar hook-length control protein FliK [Candidatus Abyssubacteria bacterium SURF_17]
MSVRFPAEFPLDLPPDATVSAAAELRHGTVLVGKVSRIASDGRVSIRFPTFDAETHAEDFLQAEKRMFAHVRRSDDRTIVQLLPNVEEGDIFEGAVLQARGRELLARFGKAELAVRSSHPETASPHVGETIRAQLQVIAGRPLLQMLPVAGPEDSVSGTVVAQRNDGTVLLKVGETILLARTAEQWQVGDAVRAAMQQTAGKLMLEILPEQLASLAEAPPEAQPAMAQAAGTQQVLDKLLALPQYLRLLEAFTAGALRVDTASQELLALLEQFSLTEAGKAKWVSELIQTLRASFLRPHEGAFAENVARAVSDSGMFFEPRLLQAALSQEPGTLASGDLKATLLVARQELAQSANAPVAGSGESQLLLAQIAPSVMRLLDALTAQQFLNLRLLPWGDLYVQLPFAGETGLNYVEIRLSQQRRGAKRRIDPKNVQLTVAVSTSRLGRIKAALSIVDGQISCQFRVARQEIAELLDANTESLRSGLEKLNYRITHIGCMTCSDERDLSVFEDMSIVHQKGFDARA